MIVFEYQMLFDSRRMASLNCQIVLNMDKMTTSDTVRKLSTFCFLGGKPVNSSLLQIVITKIAYLSYL